MVGGGSGCLFRSGNTLVKLNIDKGSGLNSINGIKIWRVIGSVGKGRLRRRGRMCGRFGMRKICILDRICIGLSKKSKVNNA